MNILIIGGDLRYAYLAQLAAGRFASVAAIGMERCPLALPRASLDDIPAAQALILPNPWRGGMSLPFAETVFSLEEVWTRARPGTTLILPDTIGMTSAPDGFNVIDLSQDEHYILKNAHLTAEGALSAAMHRARRAIMGSQCLVIGYGRIARQLARLLLALGARVTVAARRAEARAQAAALGAEVCDMNALGTLLSQMQFIFSTPPALVLPEEWLSRVREDAILMDLASPPFGFSLEAALALGKNAVRENGLPGRYCPMSAASALLEAIGDALSNSTAEGGTQHDL